MVSSAAVSSAISQEPVLGDSKPTKPGHTDDKFILRPLRLSDIPVLGEYQTRAYWRSPVNNFLAPRAPAHPEQLERLMRQGIRRRYTRPAAFSLVACPAVDPGLPVAYAQYVRLGDDEDALSFVREKGWIWRAYLCILNWAFWAYDKVDGWLVPDTISDLQNVKTFSSWMEEDKAKYWTPYPERANRWHTNSVVVSPDYQGKGIGKLLMAEVLKKAQRERVPCGLTASPHGEFLYRKLGFDFLGDFSNRPEEETANDANPGGGVMCWYPEGWDGRRID
jgi:GNAT superfamily N-acetyltransferase